MELKLNLDQLKTDPFQWMDRLDLSVGRFDFNLLAKYRYLQTSALLLAILAGGCWLLFGFDSCIGQPMMTLYNLPNYLAGHMTLADLTQVWNNAYGKEFHYSAVVIYGVAFYVLSKHFQKQGITGSKNVAYACGLTWVSIGLFELYWMASFAYFQAQPWVLTPAWPQLRILIQNLGCFLLGGGFVLLYMWVDSYILDAAGEPIGRRWHFNWSLVSTLLVLSAIGTAVVWWNYPFQSTQISVTYETGEVWTSSPQFPQTLYTIDVNPHDSLNAGVWFWVENNLLHAWNTLVKVFFTLTFVSVGWIKKVNL